MKTEDIVKTVLQILTFIATFTVVSVIAAGIYAAFYLSFVPKPIHEGPVHFVFEPCNEEMGKCGFLNGSIQLGNPPPVLLTDQEYSLSLELEMPESNINRDLGMFMTCAQILSKDKLLMRKNCKSTSVFTMTLCFCFLFWFMIDMCAYFCFMSLHACPMDRSEESIICQIGVCVCSTK